MIVHSDELAVGSSAFEGLAFSDDSVESGTVKATFACPTCGSTKIFEGLSPDASNPAVDLEGWVGRGFVDLETKRWTPRAFCSRECLAAYTAANCGDS